jgi:hypothetical protein
MTVIIDTTNSNPETSITYSGDATTMVPGSSEWDAWFGIYPCLFKDGVEVGKLNPNNFAQFEDGSSADITSGNNGDVMIAFPRRGLKIETVGDMIHISMTNALDDSDFKYYAHQRGINNKNVFYLGAYKAYVTNSKMRSLSGKSPNVSQTSGWFRAMAQNNGVGYDQSAYFQLVYRQAMYILKYKNLDSQSLLGSGQSSGSGRLSTGRTNNIGMNSNSSSGTQMKLFGLEDFYGNIYEFIEGVYINSSIFYTTTENFADLSGYQNNGTITAFFTAQYVKYIYGNNEMGFISKAGGGRSSTYFCDGQNVDSTATCLYGGHWTSGARNGVFSSILNANGTISDTGRGGRLMYL